MENNCDERVILTVWVCDCYREGVLDAVVDYEGEALNDRSKLERLVMVALWCIQEDPSMRPTMKKVVLLVQMVEGVVEVHVPPCHLRLQEQVETNFVLYCDHLKTRYCYNVSSYGEVLLFRGFFRVQLEAASYDLVGNDKETGFIRS